MQLTPVVVHESTVLVLTAGSACRKLRASFYGAIAQLGERLHGMQEVGGSIPPSSTKSYRKIVLRPHRLEA